MLIAMLERTTIIISIIFFFTMSSCRNELFMSHTTADVDFTQFNSYAFIPGKGTIGFDDDVIRFMSIQLVKTELDARGFTLDVDNPDFLVRVHTLFRSFNDPTVNPDFRSPWDGPGPRFYFQGQAPAIATPSEAIPNIEYAPGSIVVEVIDVVKGAMLWNAWSERPIRPRPLQEDLENYIGNLFSNFPVAP
jgi:hypothetical protein